MTAKQTRFVEEYLVDLCAAGAARRAGYSERTARTIGAENLTKPDIAAAIGAGHRAAAKRAELRADRVLEELRRIAFADIRDVMSVTGGRLAVADTADLTPEQAAAIAEIAQTPAGLRVRLHSKLAALDALARRLLPAGAGPPARNVTPLGLTPETRQRTADLLGVDPGSIPGPNGHDEANGAPPVRQPEWSTW